MVPGSYILSLSPQAIVATHNELLESDPTLHDLLPSDVDVSAYRLVGNDHEGPSETGCGGFQESAKAGLRSQWVHIRRRSGSWRSGAVEIYEWTSGGWNNSRW